MIESVAVIDGIGALHLSGHGEPVPWWSFGKTVLAIAALRLVEKNALSLDTPVRGARYTLRQLLRHRAGLADYGSLPSYHADVAARRTPWPVNRLLADTEAHRLRFAPGTGWAYSNIGYLKIAELIANASGMALGPALDALVFAPAGVVSARIALTPADLEGVEMGGEQAYHPGWVYHGLLVGTVPDAARLLHALVGGRLLAPGTFAEMLQSHPLPEHRSDAHPDPAYGLGLMLSATAPADHPIGHSGGGPGSRIAVYAQGGTTAAVWVADNGTLDPDMASRELLTRTSRAVSHP